MAAYEVLLLNTAVPQIQAAQAGDTYVVPRNIAVNAQMTVTGNVGIGTSSPTTKLQIEESNTGAASELLTVYNSGTASGTEARIKLAGGNGLSTRYAYISAINNGASAGNGHSLVFATNANSASPAERLRIDSSGALIAKPAAGTGAVFNEDGVDADFRVESDTNTHALFVQGSDGFVGIGTSTPAVALDVSGVASASNVRATTTFQLVDSLSSARNILDLVSDDLRIQTGTTAGARSIYFVTENIERARIKSTGQFRFIPLAADPAGAEAGDVYYNSGTNKLRLYDGTSWVDLN